MSVHHQVEYFRVLLVVHVWTYSVVEGGLCELELAVVPHRRKSFHVLSFESQFALLATKWANICVSENMAFKMFIPLKPLAAIGTENHISTTVI